MLRFSLQKMPNGEVKIVQQGYYLTWVWTPIVDGKKKYIICPVLEFTQNQKLFSKLDASSQEKIKVFREDAQQLYNTDNQHVPQYIYNAAINTWQIEPQE